MDNMRTREEVEEQIHWMEKRVKELYMDLKNFVGDVQHDPGADLIGGEIIRYQNQIYALLWAKGFVSGYKF